MPNLNILIGNIGSGKGVIAHKLSLLENAVVVNMDRIQAMFAAGDYDRYDNAKKDVYHATEEAAIRSALSTGLSVVIDRTNMDKKRRERFIQIGKEYAASIIAYNWGPGDVTCLNRRIKSPRGIPSEDWGNVYDFMAKSYEEPTEEEGFDEIIKPPERYRFYAFDFDGTIVQNNFPQIGDIVDGTVQKLNGLYEDIRNVIIVWTCRAGDMERQMRAFLLRHRIPFDFINENPIWDPGSRKLFAHEYYDDRNRALNA